MQFIRSQMSPRLACRLFSSSSYCATSFTSSPAPPRLPKDEQELYEKLQKSSTGAFSTSSLTAHVNESSVPYYSTSRPSKPQINQSPSSETISTNPSDEVAPHMNVNVKATGDGDELHPDIRRGVQPEFEGDRNPKTGEVGGPKNDPLRWGGGVDWSYNGRVTDF